MYMGVDDWAMACSWPPVGDQWQYNADQFFEPLELFGNKSGEAEFQLLNDDVVVQNNSTLSDGGSRTYSVGSVVITLWLLYCNM